MSITKEWALKPGPTKKLIKHINKYSSPVESPYLVSEWQPGDAIFVYTEGGVIRFRDSFVERIVTLFNQTGYDSLNKIKYHNAKNMEQYKYQDICDCIMARFGIGLVDKIEYREVKKSGKGAYLYGNPAIIFSRDTIEVKFYLKEELFNAEKGNIPHQPEIDYKFFNRFQSNVSKREKPFFAITYIEPSQLYSLKKLYPKMVEGKGSNVSVW